MFKYIASYNRVMPCFVNVPGLEPIAQLFIENRMSAPLVFKAKVEICDTSEEAYDVIKARITKVDGADLWSYGWVGITQYQLVENLGDMVKAKIYLDGFGYPHMYSARGMYSSFEQVTQDFLRDSMLDVWKFNACNRQDLLKQCRYLSPAEAIEVRRRDELDNNISYTE